MLLRCEGNGRVQRSVQIIVPMEEFSQKKNGNALMPEGSSLLKGHGQTYALINVVAYNNYFLPVGPCVDVVGL